MNTTTLIVAGGAALALLYLVTNQNQSQPQADTGSSDTTDQTASNDQADPADPGTAAADQSNPSTIDSLMTIAKSALGMWSPPAAYADLIAQTERENDIPENMLARLLYQECRWRDDIITGSTTSSAGAQGIAQFMPATAKQLGIDPLDPAQAIPAAGKYLAQQFWKFGTWGQALAAYNWGPGNVARKGLAVAPKETRDYVAQILADVNAADSTNLA